MRLGQLGRHGPVALIADLGAAIHLSMEPSSKGPPLGLPRPDRECGEPRKRSAPGLGRSRASVPGLLSARLTLAMGNVGRIRAGRGREAWRPPFTRHRSGSCWRSRSPPRSVLAASTCPSTSRSPRGERRCALDPAPWSNRSERRVGVRRAAGPAHLAVADMPRSSVVLGGPGPDLTRAAILLSLPAVSVTAQGRTDLAASAAQSITFTDGDIARGATRRVASTGLARSLTSSLLWSLKLSIAGADPGLMVLLKPLLGTDAHGGRPLDRRHSRRCAAYSRRTSGVRGRDYP